MAKRSAPIVVSPDASPKMPEKRRPVQPEPTEDLHTDPRWLAVHRIVTTESFAKSSRLSSFLLYVSERTLLGRTEEVTELQIGIHVFDRSSDYNPAEDNIVRQTARALRQRLALFYQEEGRAELIRVVVPRGGYVPQFEMDGDAIPLESSLLLPPASEISHSQASSAELSDELERPAEPATSVTKAAASRWWLTLGAGVAIGLAIAAVGAFTYHSMAHPTKAADKLWTVLFTSNRRTLIVPGDAGINMYGNLSKHQVDVTEYSTASYLGTASAQTPQGFTWAPFAVRRYTTMADLKLVSALTRLPTAAPDKIEIRFARDLRFVDLKDSNVILIGAPNYDPWIQLFDKHLDFTMRYEGSDNTIIVNNKAPKAGEVPGYKWSGEDPTHTGYASIALTDNLEGTGKVLIVEGTTMYGVEAATDFLFSSQSLGEVIREADKGDGTISNFEILLETTLYNGGTSKAKVVAKHIHSAPSSS